LSLKASQRNRKVSLRRLSTVPDLRQRLSWNEEAAGGRESWGVSHHRTTCNARITEPSKQDQIRVWLIKVKETLLFRPSIPLRQQRTQQSRSPYTHFTNRVTPWLFYSVRHYRLTPLNFNVSRADSHSHYRRNLIPD